MRTLRLSLLTMLAFWLLGMAILLWIRRAQGALTAFPSLGVGVATGLGLAMVAALLRWLPRPWPGEDSRDLSGPLGAATHSSAIAILERINVWAEIPSLLLGLPCVAAAMLALAISLPGSSTPGLVALWVLLAIEETHAWTRFATLGRTPWMDPASPTEADAVSTAASTLAPADQAPLDAVRSEQDTQVSLAGTASPNGSSSERDPFGSPNSAVIPEDLSAEVDEQWSRATLPDGAQTIQGLVRARLAAGQRTVSVHLAFCPPLWGEPELEFEQVDGPEARIQLGALLGHGARLDVRLLQAEPAATAVLIEFAVQAPASAPE